MSTIHCVLHGENLVAKNIGNRDLIAILQMVVSSVDKIRTRAFQDRLFQEACSDKKFTSGGLCHRRMFAFNW